MAPITEEATTATAPNEEKRDDSWIDDLYRDVGGEG